MNNTTGIRVIKSRMSDGSAAYDIALEDRNPDGSGGQSFGFQTNARTRAEADKLLLELMQWINKNTMTICEAK